MSGNLDGLLLQYHETNACCLIGASSETLCIMHAIQNFDFWIACSASEVTRILGLKPSEQDTILFQSSKLLNRSGEANYSAAKGMCFDILAVLNRF